MFKFMPSYRRLTCLLFLLFSVLALPWWAGASTKADIEPVAAEEPVEGPFTVTLGKAEIMEIDSAFSDVLVANPGVVNVTALNLNKLYLVGTNIGDTNIFILDENGDVVDRMDVHVTYDVDKMQSLLSRFFPHEEVEVGAIHDQIILTGTVESAEVAERITSLVGEYVGDLTDNDATPEELINNMLNVRGEQQVTLRVKIIEASRSVLKELGVETRFNDPNELSATTLFGATPPADLGGGTDAAQLFASSQLGLTQDPLATGRFLADTGISGLDLVELTINALEEEGLVNTLAEPNLTTVSGETAGFLAGGEFPVPVGRDQVGNIVIEFRSFGVSLNFRPFVLSNERVSLQMETEVSSLDFEDGVPLTGGGGAASIIPAFDVRRASTTVEVPSGGSLMIAGLLQSESTKGLTGLPGVKNAPVLGDLLKSDSFLRDETEVMIIVTPYLVEPFAEDEKQAPEDPLPRENHMADIFAVNLRRVYAIGEQDDIFGRDLGFGYILD